MFIIIFIISIIFIENLTFLLEGNLGVSRDLAWNGNNFEHQRCASTFRQLQSGEAAPFIDFNAEQA